MEDPKSREDLNSGFWLSAKVLGIFSVFLGLLVSASGYLNTSALMQAYPDWASLQFNIMVGLLMAVMGVFLILLSGRAFNIWLKNDSLRKSMEDETVRRKKAERDLARAQTLSKTGNWILELSGLEMQCSDEVYRMLGCTPKNTAINIQRFLKSVHPDDRGFVKNEIQKALSQGRAFNLTHRIIRQNGSIRMVKQRSEIYLDQEGKPTKILGTVQDITDQKEAENMAARLGRIVDKSFNEIYTFDAETLKFAKVNLAARLNLRYSMEELYGLTPEDLLPKFTREQVEELTDSLKRGIESVTVFEAVHKRKNGTLYPVDVRLQLTRSETRPQFVAIVQDITDRKRAESLYSSAHKDLDKQVHERTSDLTAMNKALQTEVDEQKKIIEVLKASEHRSIDVMNNMVDGIIAIDEEGTIHSFNRAAEHLFGFKVEEVLGQNISVLMTGPDGAQRDEYFKNLLQSKKSAALGLRRVVTIRKKDGTTFSAELAVNETVVGEQRMFTGLMRNLTEKKEVEHEWMDILNPMARS